MSAIIVIILFIGYQISISTDIDPIISLVFGFITSFYGIAQCFPLLSISIRRLHDINKSSWWMLLELIPLGSLVLLYFYCLPSVDKNNKYGPIV